MKITPDLRSVIKFWTLQMAVYLRNLCSNNINYIWLLNESYIVKNASTFHVDYRSVLIIEMVNTETLLIAFITKLNREDANA